VKTTKTPADPPQAEGRLDVFGWYCFGQTNYLMTCFVITPFLTTRILPCHGSFAFLQAG
jgi:hypothetical protein